MTEPDDRLRALLGTEPPAGVAALPFAKRAALAAVIAEARARQARDLAAAFEATLRHLPGPLRGVVKRVVR